MEPLLYRHIPAVWLCIWLLGCSTQVRKDRPEDQLAAICHFDLNRVHPTGMYEDSSGVYPLIYRFCIPAYAQMAEQVRQIDPDIYLLPDSAAPIHCEGNHWVCEGHAKDGQVIQTLQRLAALPYVDRIDQAHRP